MRSSDTPVSERKSNTKRIITIVIAAILVFLVAIVFVTALIIGKSLKNRKSTIAEYDSYANVIEDYSFILGCQNTVKCQVTESNDYNRKYIYNTYLDGNDNVILQFGPFRENYEYEKKELFKGINQAKPFPDAALPYNLNSHIEFRHYQSKVSPDITFIPENIHNQVAISFVNSMSYKEVMEYNKTLNDLGYAIKFCWVDTYLPGDVTSASKYAIGRTETLTPYGDKLYSDYDSAYGFLLYDHDYPNKTDFNEPAQKFIDIISTQYEDNFMSEELSTIRNNLSQKDELSEDKLEIIGVVLEKQDGSSFSIVEITKIFDGSKFINFIFS